MGNFAENLNLGNRFRPPPCDLPAMLQRPHPLAKGTLHMLQMYTNL